MRRRLAQLARPATIALAATLVTTGCVPTPDEVEALIHQQEREISALHERTAILREHAARCDDPTVSPPPIFAELHQVLRMEGVTVEREGRKVMVTIAGDTLFSSGGTRVKRSSMMILDMLSTALNLHPEHPINVVGHTDNRGTSGGRLRNNWELSAARASAVAVSLISNFEVDASRFHISGRADQEPIADNGNSAGRRENRRVVIEILPPRE